jgi:hypothetical protein
MSARLTKLAVAALLLTGGLVTACGSHSTTHTYGTSTTVPGVGSVILAGSGARPEGSLWTIRKVETIFRRHGVGLSAAPAQRLEGDDPVQLISVTASHTVDVEVVRWSPSVGVGRMHLVLIPVAGGRGKTHSEWVRNVLVSWRGSDQAVKAAIEELR